MNLTRHKLKENASLQDMGLERARIYLGNKIIRSSYEGRDYYDVSLNKEIFYERDGIFYALSDFSNFQLLWKSQNGNDVYDDINFPYAKVEGLSPLEKEKHYAILLKEAYKYLGPYADVHTLLSFIRKYNKKLVPRAMQEIKKDNLGIADWWYTGGEIIDDEDIVEITSTYEENLLPTLNAVSGNLINHKKLIKKLF